MSFVLDKIPWPARSGMVVFCGNGVVLVDAEQVRWTANPELDSLLGAVSYSPYLLHLSNPTVGKVDLWVRTTVLRSSLRNEMQMPLEAELTQLLRAAANIAFVAHPTDDPLAETPPSTVGRLVSGARLKIMDELFWDMGVGGFVKGAVPFDVPSLPLSLVFAPCGSAWNSQLLTSSFEELCSRLPTTRGDPLSLRTPTVLVIDPAAPFLDTRILSLQQINSQPFLRIRLSDMQAWMNQTQVPSFNGTCSSVLSLRKGIAAADADGRFSLHPYHLHWKAAVWPLGTVFQGRVPRADWVFAVSTSPEGWATGFVHSTPQFDHLRAQLRHGDGLPEFWDMVARNSWRLPLQKKRLMIRLQFYEVSAAERAVFRNTRNRMMSSFGLVEKADGSWSAKAGMLRLLKRDGVLPADRLESCLEGFPLTNALELLHTTKPQCIICATHPCNAFLDLCGHTFCDTCLTQHVTHGGTSCPVCRAELTETGWTQVRRTTSRRVDSGGTFSKQEQVVSLSQNLRGSKCFVMPNAATAEQVLSWLGTLSNDVMLACPGDFVPHTAQFDHLICTTALLPSATCITLLHKLMQKHSTDTTTLHVLVASRTATVAQEETDWVREFSRCYSHMIEMSSYG